MSRLPRRKVVTRSPHRRVGYVSCPWVQTTQVQYESLLELNFIRLALLCPGGLSIEEQPFRLALPDGSSYTPDFLLHLTHQRKLVIEVKPSVFVAKHRETLTQAHWVLGENGHEFIIMTDDLIHAGKRHERASLILRYARSHDVPALVERCQTLLSAMSEPMRMDEFMRHSRLERYQVLALVGRRHLHLPPDLSDEVLYPIHNFEGKDDVIPSGAAWLSHQER